MSPVEGQIFAICSGSGACRRVPSFLILNVVPMPKIVLLDGLLVAASSSLRIPTAYSIIFERVGDLSRRPGRRRRSCRGVDATPRVRR